MSPIAYPSSLPGPESYSLTSADRVSTPTLDGAKRSRARRRDRFGTANVAWFFDIEQYAVWTAWYTAELLNGQRAAAIPLPGPGGLLPRRCLFLAPAAVGYEAGMGYRVTVKMLVSQMSSGEVIADITPPVLLSALGMGTTITLRYLELESGLSNAKPGVSDYIVTVDGIARDVVSVAIDSMAKTVSLTISGASLADGQVVQLTYTPSSTPLRDMAGNVAAAFDVPVVVLTEPDTVGPELVASTAGGNEVLLTYVDEGAGLAGVTPDVGAYIVTVDGAERAVTGVAVDPASQTVTVAFDGAALVFGQVVLLSYAPDTTPIQDVAGNLAGSLSARVIINVESDVVAPDLVTASAFGTRVLLTYVDAESGMSSATPAAGDYVVTVAGTARAVTAVAVNALEKTVTLTIGGAVLAFGQAVALSYTPGATPVQDVAGNPVAALVSHPVVNLAQDTIAPALLSAEASGVQVVLAYTEDGAGLSSIRPAPGDYAITVDGTPRAITAVTLDTVAKAITLDLSGAAFVFGQEIRLSYAPGAFRLQDVAGNFAAALVSIAVANLATETVAPVLDAATASGNSVLLTYVETGSGLASITPAVGDYAVTVAGAARAVTAVLVDTIAKTVTLTLVGSPLVFGEAVLLSYTPGTLRLQDVAGNFAEALAAIAVANLSPEPVAPVLSSATASGNLALLTYTVTGLSSTTPAVGDYAITVAGAARSVTAVLVNTSAKTVSLTFDGPPLVFGEAVLLDYTPGVTPIQDVKGYVAAALVAELVTNTTAQVLSVFGTIRESARAELALIRSLPPGSVTGSTAPAAYGPGGTAGNPVAFPYAWIAVGNPLILQLSDMHASVAEAFNLEIQGTSDVGSYVGPTLNGLPYCAFASDAGYAALFTETWLDANS